MGGECSLARVAGGQCPPNRLLKMQLNWHWLRVGVVYEFTALPTLPFGSLLSIKRLLRSTWAT